MGQQDTGTTVLKRAARTIRSLLPSRSALSAWNHRRSTPSAPQPRLGRNSCPGVVAAAEAEVATGQASTQQDVLQILSLQDSKPPDFGYPRDLHERFALGTELGKGGNATVRLARDLRTGQTFACKSLPKVLEDPQASDLKRNGNAAAIKREVEVLRKLRGALNVACLEAVYEDDFYVHIVMEHCKGGELWHRVGDRHYSERTVASFMRAVLRTLAQCHSHHILHRDIKPGNFMLLDDDERAHLKAIDFGLAVPFDPAKLPRSDLGLEGTPWFMAPEVLSSSVGPESDMWSAGVMAHQLLTGRFPFDDKRNPHNPSISKIWQSILVDKLDLNRSYWAGLSDEAKDFVAQLLDRDPARRPSAKAALQHPWLRGNSKDRSTGRPLSLSVVQRIQRFGQVSLFKRSVLEHIAQDLLAARPAPSEANVCPLGRGARPLVTGPHASVLQHLYGQLEFGPGEAIDRHQLRTGLQRMGYKLDEAEVDRLLDQVDIGGTGRVARSQLAASQIDWRAVQESNVDRWLECVQRAFAELDADGDGVLSKRDVLAAMRAKLPPAEVDAAVRHAMAELHGTNSSQHGSNGSQHGSQHGSPRGVDFDAFLKMLRCDSTDSLDQYDDRLVGVGGSGRGAAQDRLNTLLEKSIKAGDLYLRAAALEPVAEAA